MTYQEFIEIMVAEVQQKVGSAVQVKTTAKLKNNGVKWKGLEISSSDSNISSIIYLHSYFAKYKLGESLDEMVNDILEIYRTSLEMPISQIHKLFDFESIKNMLFVKLINKEANDEILKDLVYENFLDLAVVPYLYSDSNDYGISTTPIRKDYLKFWNITEEEIIKYAKDNTSHFFNNELTAISFSVNTMNVLTNDKRMYGASCILFPEFLQYVKKELNEEFFLLPSSIHEFIVIPRSFQIKVSELKEVVCSVNLSVLQPEEILSFSIYYYDGNEVLIVG